MPTAFATPPAAPAAAPPGAPAAAPPATPPGAPAAAPAAASVIAPALEHAAWTVDALRSVWARQQGRVSERIDTLERAIAALGDDRLDAALTEEARRAAHMLAGSLGMFGFLRAARAAHCIEVELTHPARDRAPVLAALSSSVRSGVRGPVVLSVEPPSFKD
jgi:HPt (histidine-containing phosphotransfer) domain-containing protein